MNVIAATAILTALVTWHLTGRKQAAGAAGHFAAVLREGYLAGVADQGYAAMVDFSHNGYGRVAVPTALPRNKHAWQNTELRGSQHEMGVDELDKYEFKTVRVPRGKWSRDAALNRYGARGWEVIAVKDLWQAHVTVSMKRRKPEKPPRITKEKPIPVRDERPQPLADEGPLVVRHRMPEYSGGFWAWITGRH